MARKVNISGRFFNAVAYGLDGEGFLDYDEAERLAHEHRPKLIICGTTAYPRTIDWQRFRAIADDVGAFLACRYYAHPGSRHHGAAPEPNRRRPRDDDVYT